MVLRGPTGCWNIVCTIFVECEMGRRKLWSVRKTLTMDEALQDRITEYWMKNPRLEDELAAIRRLLDIALAKEGIA